MIYDYVCIFKRLIVHCVDYVLMEQHRKWQGSKAQTFVLFLYILFLLLLKGKQEARVTDNRLPVINCKERELFMAPALK